MQGGVNIVTLAASFQVEAINYDWDGGAVNAFALNKKAADSSYERELDKVSEYTFKPPKLDLLSMTRSVSPVDKRKSIDFIIEDDEVAANMAKVNSVLRYDKQINAEQMREVLEANAKSMYAAMEKFKAELAKAGLTTEINTYNDIGHAIGVGSDKGSHILGQKIDLTFYNSSKQKLTSQNMTADQKEAIKAAAAAAGLVPNWETSNGQGSFWGDFSLANAKTIDYNGKVSTINIKTWTGDKMKNTKTGDYEEFATK